MSVAGPQRLHQLLDAVVAIGSDLELPAILHRITELAAELADARYVALGVLDPTGSEITEFITVGVDDATRAEIGDFPTGKGILGLLIREPEPLRLADLGDHPDSFGFPPGHPAMKSFLGVPIRARGKVFGILYLTEKLDRQPFTDVDEEIVIGLAAAAGVAIDNARLHATLSDQLVIEERERIARELHDSVIQRLFATGMSLQGTVSLIGVEPEAVGKRVEAAIDELDETVKQIRTAIFALDAVKQGGVRIRDRIGGLCREVNGALGFEPVATFYGPVDQAISEELADDLLSTLREALSNVARHARATAVEVSVDVTDDEIVLRIFDDGLGLDSLEHELGGQGLPNMAARAGDHGGRLELEPGPPVGTSLVWRVPRP